ncbi:Cytochrome c oxidase subunit 6A [Basidiobolus ranarum]|uniref:Cytochrome c oxidase subunit 6A n=1 Tax=Basidiobolus ranarum TaxID=34480 RepID=A0ABR2WXS0_9FUNG
MPLVRRLLTTTLQGPSKRLYSSGVQSNYAQHLEHVHDHARQSAENWRKISLYVCGPLIGIAAYNAYRLLKEHEEHLEHEPLKFVAYPYIRIRNKPFPWEDSDHTLFHNPKVNLDPPAE